MNIIQNRLITFAFTIGLLATLNLPSSTLFAQNTAFIYQDQVNQDLPTDLADGTHKIGNGNYTFSFRLATAATGSNYIGGTITNQIIISARQFSTSLDFGNVFDGSPRWVEIAWKRGKEFVTLTPRQLLPSTPYALYAYAASNVLGGIAASNLTGTIANSQLANSNITINAGTGLTGGGTVNLGGATTLNVNADSANTANTIVQRDGSGNFSAGTITADLNGNAATATTAGSATTATSAGTAVNFSGSLSGDVTGTQGATVVSSVGGQSAANVGSAVTTLNNATSADVPNTLVERDANGSFSATNITLDGILNLPDPATIYSGGSLLLYSGSGNSFFAGLNAGNLTTTGNDNIGIGASALYSNASGFQNTAIGVQSLQNNTNGYNNAAVGIYSLLNNTSGAENAAFGSGALQKNVDGNGNAAFGYQALQSINGGGNVAVGANALGNSTNGNNNIAIGNNVAQNLHTGDYNIEIGNNGVDGDNNIIRIGDSQTDTYLAGVIHGDGSGLTNLVLPGDVVTTNESSVTLNALTLQGVVTANNGINVAGGNLDLSSPEITSGGTSIFDNDGNGNLFVGPGAGNVGNDNGSDNTANGGNALYSNTSGGYNTANGGNALYSNTRGDSNVAVGADALYSNTTGNNNTANGGNALYSNTRGNNNTANGNFALFSNTTGGYNTANGNGALYYNTSGGYNTANGADALSYNTSGGYNTANGNGALYYNANGNNNTANGVEALYSNTTGNGNIALGFEAGYNLTTGSNNIDIGNNGVISDNGIIRIGDSANQNSAYIAGIYGVNVSGSPVVVNSDGQLGASTSLAVQSLIASNSIAVTNITTDSGVLNVQGAITGTGMITANSGITANDVITAYNGINISSGSLNLPDPVTIYSGNASLLYSDSTNDNFFAGLHAGNPGNDAGSANTAEGYGALYYNTSGNANTANGFEALLYNTTGSDNTANGQQALSQNTTGSDNTANGAAALFYNTSGSFNTADGYAALFNLTNGSGDIALGIGAGNGLTNGNNNIDIGNLGVDGENGIIRIGATQTATYLAGDVYGNTFNATSDRNAKEDFATVNPQQVLAKVAAMPVTEWNYKTMKNAEHIGPMAQDFQAAFGLNGKDDKHISLIDEGGVALAAIQGLNQKVNEKDAEIQKQTAQIQSLQQSVAELKMMVLQLAQGKANSK